MGKKKVLNKNLYNFIVDYSALIVALLLIIINVIFTPNFFNITTISNIVIQMTSTLLISLGMTWVIAFWRNRHFCWICYGAFVYGISQVAGFTVC